jgi:hypothetical protein
MKAVPLSWMNPIRLDENGQGMTWKTTWVGRKLAGGSGGPMMRLDEENGWLKLKYKAVHSSCVSGHNGAKEDVDGDRVDMDGAAIGEGGGGLGWKTKEATMSVDRGDPNQIPKEVIFF